MSSTTSPAQVENVNRATLCNFNEVKYVFNFLGIHSILNEFSSVFSEKKYEPRYSCRPFKQRGLGRIVKNHDRSRAIQKYKKQLINRGTNFCLELFKELLKSFQNIDHNLPAISSSTNALSMISKVTP